MLINKVKSVHLQPNQTLPSFDIVDLYTNIPIQETLQTLSDNLSKWVSDDKRVINLLQIIFKLNSFTLTNQFFIQDDYLTMGLALFSLLSDIYLIVYEKDVYKRQTYIWS